MQTKSENKSSDLKHEALENGLTIYTDGAGIQKTVAVRILIKFGGMHEDGVAHLLEHMVLKSTKSRDSEKLCEQLSSFDASNASTNRVRTEFRAFGKVEDFENIMELLSDCICNPKLCGEDLKNEKGVILAEIEGSYLNMADYEARVIYGNDSPISRSVLGSKAKLKDISEAELKSLHKKYYVAKNISIVISGGIEHGKAIECAKKHFESLESGKKSEYGKHKLSLNGDYFVLGLLNSVVARISFANKYGWLDRKALLQDVKCQVISNIMSHGPESSRIFGNLRKKGALYSCRTCVRFDLYRSMFYFQFECKDENVKDNMKHIFSEIHKLNTEKNPISEDELRQAKEVFKLMVLKQFDGNLERSSELSFQLANYGRCYSDNELLEILDSIKAEDLHDLAKELFRPQNMCVVIDGRYEDCLKKQYALDILANGLQEKVESVVEDASAESVSQKFAGCNL